MAELSAVVISMADDDECMGSLSEHCGIEDRAEVRSAYRAGIGVIADRLVELGGGEAANTSLVRASRMLERGERRDPRAQFELGRVVGDELLFEVFGIHTDAVVDRLVADEQLSASKARGVLEVATAVVLGAAADSIGDQPTFGSLAALLAGASGGSDSTVGSGSGSGSGGTAELAGGGAVAEPGANEPSAAGAGSAGSAGDGSSRSRQHRRWPGQVVAGGCARRAAPRWAPSYVLAIGGDDGGADDGADDDLAFTDESADTGESGGADDSARWRVGWCR